MPDVIATVPGLDLAHCTVSFTVNGAPVTVEVSALDTLLETLRGPLGLTGSKGACHEGECGSCTVLVDGVPMNACLILTPQIADQAITTVEGLAQGDVLDPIQQAFIDHGAVQCGYCTPGLVVAAHAFLREHPQPTRTEIQKGLEGNICRCTGYTKVLDAVVGAIAPAKEAI